MTLEASFAKNRYNVKVQEPRRYRVYRLIREKSFSNFPGNRDYKIVRYKRSESFGKPETNCSWTD